MLLFELGRVFITPAAQTFCELHAIEPGRLLARHASGDWGDLDAQDTDSNQRAILYGTRILSNYLIVERTRESVWIITEGDRSATTILLPGDY